MRRRLASIGWVARWLMLALALTLSGSVVPAEPAGAESGTAPPAVLEVFVREGCPRCADAKVFLVQLTSMRPGLRIVLRHVDQDAQARDELSARSRAAGIWPPGVPTFVFDGRVMVGFDDAGHAGRELIELIDHSGGPKEQVDTALFGALSVSRLGLPLFTLALGLLDGFNPCAMWVLLFLLSLLVRLRNRTRMAIVAGTFVLVSGAVYYAFMAAWLNVFLVVGLSAAVSSTLGVLALVIGAFNVKDFFAWGRGPSLVIPASAKPGLHARMRRVTQAPSLPSSLLAVAALAVLVNFVELLCTAGFPAVFTAVLAKQDLTPAAHYAYLGLYIMGYIADDSLMVGLAVTALSSGKLTERAGRWLKFLSGVAMLGLGAVILLRPGWLL